MAAPLPVPSPGWGRQLLDGLLAWFGAWARQDLGEVGGEVLDRAKGGDHLAFAEIVSVYDERLRALAFRLLGDRARMDDALQNAYLQAYRALPRFKGQSAFGTWLYRIAYNACLDELRRARNVVPLFADETGPEQASSAPGPAEVAVGRQDLGAALDALPVDQRAAVLLVDAYGLDYAEAAEVLGVRAGTIASRLSRARTALRSALEAGQ